MDPTFLNQMVYTLTTKDQGFLSVNIDLTVHSRTTSTSILPTHSSSAPP